MNKNELRFNINTQNKNNTGIPTENFVTSNERIMATINAGQLTTDHNIGISGFFSPDKRSRTLIQSSRFKIFVDGSLHEPYDDETRSVVTDRGYIPGTNIVFDSWKADEVEIQDYYYMPPELDVVIQRVKIRNNSQKEKQIKCLAILYPQLNAVAYYKKGVCKEAYYDMGKSCIVISDMKGNYLFYGLNLHADEYQVGQVCGKTDVYYDIEDGFLDGNLKVSNVVTNAALGTYLGILKPGEEKTLEICLGRAGDKEQALIMLDQFRSSSCDLLENTKSWWCQWMNKSEVIRNIHDLNPRIRQIEKMARVVLKSHQDENRVMMCGSIAYQGAIAARNSVFSQIAMDRMGFNDEVVPGYEFFTEFKVGDDRFSSPDENDQLGTIIHSFRRHYELTGNMAFIERNYVNIRTFAHQLIELIDPKYSLIYSERSIHEFIAISRGFETYVNVMAFRGLDDAAYIAKLLSRNDDEKAFEYSAKLLKDAIINKLYCHVRKTFAKRLYQNSLDTTPAISMFTPALFGVIAPLDERVTNTLHYIYEHIWDKEIGGVYRYPLEKQPWDEIPFSGPWVTYTSWLARVFIKRGEMEMARECIHWVVNNISADSNCIPEHFSCGHIGRRGFHRIYTTPAVPETWATAEFMMLVYDYCEAMDRKSVNS